MSTVEVHSKYKKFGLPCIFSNIWQLLGSYCGRFVSYATDILIMSITALPLLNFLTDNPALELSLKAGLKNRIFILRIMEKMVV